MGIAVKKGSKLYCKNCGKVAYIAVNDIAFNSRISSLDIKTPTRDCKFNEQVRCENCSNTSYLELTRSSSWVYDKRKTD